MYLYGFRGISTWETMYKVTGNGFVPPNASLETCLQNGQLASETSWLGAYVGDIRVATGTETPSFKKALRSGAILPLNAYSQYESKVTSASSSWNLTTDSGLVCTASSNETASHIPLNMVYPAPEMFGIWLEKAGFDGQLYCQEAAARLATRYFDAGTFVAELRETIMSFKGLLRRFISLLSKPDLDKVINAWLEARYGWRPLYADILSFIKTVNRPREKFPLYKERVGRNINYSEHELFDFGAYKILYDLNVTISGRGSVYSKYEPAAFRVAPITTAWELVPFSFIVDWFFTVGSALTAWETKIEFPDLICSSSYKLDYSITAKVQDFHVDGFSGPLNAQSSGNGWAIARIPTALSSEVKFQPHLGILELIDLLAIARQILFKK